MFDVDDPDMLDEEPAAILLCQLAAQFYTLGWNLGTGGGISIQDQKLLFLSPSGVHKERMKPSDCFIWDSDAQDYIEVPEGKRPSASSVLFIWLHEHHGAGCVIHTHSLYSNLASRSGVFEISDQEYIKGLPDYQTGKMLKNTDTLRIPVIENKPTEDMLLEDLMTCAKRYPQAPCILVRNHGAYHFGKDAMSCKAQAECLEYLFELDWKIHSR